MRLEGLGTSPLLASSSPAPSLSVRSCSCACAFAYSFFQPGPRGIGLAVPLPLPPSVRSSSFHLDSSGPCRAHERHRPGRSRRSPPGGTLRNRQVHPFGGSSCVSVMIGAKRHSVLSGAGQWRALFTNRASVDRTRAMVCGRLRLSGGFVRPVASRRRAQRMSPR